jgi:RNA polymerase sigma-70 factor (ECF subfamily)
VDRPDDPALAACFARGKDAWPQIPCELAVFQRVAWAWHDRTGRAFDRANSRDLYLAAAIADGAPAAFAAFDHGYLARTRPALRRLGLHDAAVDDVLQIVRERLLVASEPQTMPKLATLVGDGQLEALLRVIVVRTGHNFRRDQKLDRSGSEDDAVVERIAVHDESLVGKDARQRLRGALRDAIAQLAPRDRTLLRLHFCHGMTIDALGSLYDVHRATAARWLTRIIDDVEHRVSAGFGPDDDQSLPSILAIVRSGMSIGLFGAE